jgi:hypothetical protein
MVTRHASISYYQPSLEPSRCNSLLDPRHDSLPLTDAHTPNCSVTVLVKLSVRYSLKACPSSFGFPLETLSSFNYCVNVPKGIIPPKWQWPPALAWAL